MERNYVPLRIRWLEIINEDDIENGKIQDVPDLTQNVEKDILAEKLKMSCTNVMLQCLDTESRCIFIFGNDV